MSEPVDHLPPDSITVACLCAEWCGTCREYRTVFERAVEGQRHAGVRGLWIDVEDESDLVGAVDADIFPPLLMVRGGEVAVLRTIPPQASSLPCLFRAASVCDTSSGGGPP